MRNAFLAILLIAPMFAILGTMVVNNKMSFFSDALGHSSLTGIAIGVLFGTSNHLFSMVIFSIILSIIILKLKEANTSSVDTIIGVISSTSVALGIVILSKNGGFNKYSSYLIGDLLSISQNDLILLLVSFIVVLVIWSLCFNKLLLVSINQTLAKSRGIDTKFYEYLFTILVAVVVTVSIKWVGMLVLSSLLILPSASARNIAKDVKSYHIYSIVIGLLSGIIGLMVSYKYGYASGATIVLISSMFFVITFIKGKYLKSYA
ncbi:MAG: metal ABC transporter permease [Peptostreptococcaceae bacterium]